MPRKSEIERERERRRRRRRRRRFQECWEPERGKEGERRSEKYMEEERGRTDEREPERDKPRFLFMYSTSFMTPARLSRSPFISLRFCGRLACRSSSPPATLRENLFNRESWKRDRSIHDFSFLSSLSFFNRSTRQIDQSREED